MINAGTIVREKNKKDFLIVESFNHDGTITCIWFNGSYFKTKILLFNDIEIVPDDMLLDYNETSIE